MRQPSSGTYNTRDVPSIFPSTVIVRLPHWLQNQQKKQKKNDKYLYFVPTSGGSVIFPLDFQMSICAVIYVVVCLVNNQPRVDELKKA